MIRQPRSYVWWIRIPGHAYAYSYHFEDPVTLDEAKKYIREQMKIRSLPRGSELWPGGK